MLQSHIIEVEGVFVGVAVRIDRGYRFVAIDFRLKELDTSVWPTLDDVRLRARRSADGYFGRAGLARASRPLISRPARS